MLNYVNTHILWSTMVYGIEKEKKKLKNTQTSESHIRTSKKKKKEVYENRFINKTRDLFIILIAILEY